MHKTFTGTVVSTKMQDTVVVEVTRQKPHPIYKKLLKRSKKYKVAPNSHSVSEGDVVKMEETRQIGKGKYFKIVDIVRSQSEQAGRKEKSHGTAKK